MAASDVQKQNLVRIFHLLRTEGSMTRQDIARRLNLSMPTTLQNVSELLAAGILEEGQAIRSTGGRRAREVRLNSSAGFALGIEVALEHLTFVLTDLMGKPLHMRSVSSTFLDETAWYQQLGRSLQQFLCEHEIDRSCICGAGVSFPGIIDTEAERVIHSHIFHLEYMSLDRFRKYIPFPLVFANDANCACEAERSPSRQNFLYVSLNDSVGGAIMRNGKILLGNTFQAGEIGHMILIPDGKRCYCGKHGCVDAYLSPRTLTNSPGNLDAFFNALRTGSNTEKEIWDNYLKYLSILLTNLRMLENTDIVVGGAVSQYLSPCMELLKEIARQYDRFARDVDYIHLSQKRNSCAVGAAVLALEQYAVNYIV